MSVTEFPNPWPKMLKMGSKKHPGADSWQTGDSGAISDADRDESRPSVPQMKYEA